jgi:hypothetical protein
MTFQKPSDAKPKSDRPISFVDLRNCVSRRGLPLLSYRSVCSLSSFHGENVLTEAFAYSQSVLMMQCIFCVTLLP